MKLVVLLPALNEEKHLPVLLSKFPSQIDGVSEIVPLVIDDGSTDQTANVARHAGAMVVSHGHNYGVGKAFQTGVECALEYGADIVVTMDSDNQFDPREIESLVQPILKRSFDVVLGDRFTDKQGHSIRHTYMPRKRYWGNIVISKIIGFVAGHYYPDVSCGFRAYSREALLRVNIFHSFDHVQEVLLDLHFKEMQVVSKPITVDYLPGRTSRVAYNLITYGWNVLKLTIRIFKDYKPFLFFSIVSLPFAGATLWFCYMGIMTGWTDLWVICSLMSFFAMVIFLTLGVLADMLVKIRLNQENQLYYAKKERYCVKSSLNT